MYLTDPKRDTRDGDGGTAVSVHGLVFVKNLLSPVFGRRT